MSSKKNVVKILTIFVCMFLVASCSKDEAGHTALHPKTEISSSIHLEVHKSPTCSCCEKWISHINDNGFESKVHSSQTFSVIKDQKDILPRFRSCHTAISKEGYVFEGHVPAKYIQQFLNENHGENIIGLSVPAMPLGSPGMEVGDKFHPYKVLLLKSGGTYDIYADVQTYEDQF